MRVGACTGPDANPVHALAPQLALRRRDLRRRCTSLAAFRFHAGRTLRHGATRPYLPLSAPDFGGVELAALDEPESVDDDDDVAPPDVVPDVPVPAPDVVLPVEPMPDEPVPALPVAVLPGEPVPAALDDVSVELELDVVPDVVPAAPDEGVVVEDDELLAGGGTTTVVDDDEGGAELDGGVSWRCWQAPSASSTLAATAVVMKRFICRFSLAGVSANCRMRI